ncbi:isoprenylcysteine carboxylmethyltransferase family protein [Novosphingobium sp. Gsoil 351]|uniref:methyltransferase family protein n=1 Tax=Novosphingobium sp. Gsoil 351 TaxID=2675225 RepID=UPI0012B4D815|nr:isoprenylcysteine carboxylmethyltransferase family protein [Novosphingobium sp. Gsoil 351]QGN53620.1 isoprenylcysteine carboxylmethyltransferase family protein [Novosphingobium sp. Gsoil 351]
MAELIRWTERLFLLALSAGVVARIAPRVIDHPQLAIFLLAELLGMVLVLIQRRGEWSSDAYPLLVAFVGTGAVLLVVPDGSQLIPNAASAVLIFGGASISLAAKVFLGRSFGLVAANRGVKFGGVYRLVRHPMYLGYILNQVGFLMLYFSPWNIAVYAVAWTAQYLRTVEEEKFLRRDPIYREYAERVRFRLVPGIA